VSAILALLIAGSMSHALSQTQSNTHSDEDEADILESLIKQETKQLGGQLGTVRYFSSENIGSLATSRIKDQGFWVITPFSIETQKRDYVVNYIAIRSILSENGIVVVNVAVVTEGRPCFAPAFSSERSFSYWFKKSGNEWVGQLGRRPSPLLSPKSIANPLLRPLL
jgi:hypothetical protein